jgi:site-specific recombinase XerD
MKAPQPTALARCLRDFLGDHLPRLRGCSPHTVLSYRDSLALLLRFLVGRSRKRVTDLDLDDIGPDEVIAFLQHLEQQRGSAA